MCRATENLNLFYVFVCSALEAASGLSTLLLERYEEGHSKVKLLSRILKGAPEILGKLAALLDL